MPVGNAIIGALRATLGIDTAQFETGLKSAQVSLKSFGTSMKGPMIAAAAALTAAAGAMAVGIKHALDSADELGKAAQKFGVPVEQLSLLSRAAALSDISLESLGQGLKKLSQNIANAGGDTGTVTDRLMKIADQFAAMPDGVNKTALAVKYFGKTGTELIPFLNEGSAGIKKLTDEMRELGLEVDGKTADAADRFGDNLDELSLVITGIFTKLAAGVAGPLADFTGQLVAITKDGNLAAMAADSFKVVLDAIPPIMIDLNELLAYCVRILTRLGEASALIGAGEFSKLSASAEVFKNDMVEIAAQAERLRGALRFQKLQGMAPDVPATVKKTADEVEDLVSKTKEVRDTIGEFPELIPAGYADLVVAGDRYQAQVKETGKLWNDIGETLENQILGAINSLIEGTLTWKSALASALRAAASIFGSIGSQSIADAGGWGSILGFAGGGSFKVGGAGGIDSQLVAFRASPDETVSITRPGDERDQSMVLNYSPVIDARGSQISEARIRAILAEERGNFLNAVPAAIKQAKVRSRL